MLPLLAAGVLTVVVHGHAAVLVSTSCSLELRSEVVGGGTETYCLERFHGRPGPHAVVRDSGRMTFRLTGGSIMADVGIVERFAADGRHARQTLTGSIRGGSGRFRGVRGTIAGGGTLVEFPVATVTSSNLRYAFRL